MIRCGCFVSITEDLGHVHYSAEIVGWNDKTLLTANERQVIERVLKALQPGEDRLYDKSSSFDGRSLNLIHVRRATRINNPFPVGRLLKVYGGDPLLLRTQAGGWAYVWSEPAPEQDDEVADSEVQ